MSEVTTERTMNNMRWLELRYIQHVMEARDVIDSCDEKAFKATAMGKMLLSKQRHYQTAFLADVTAADVQEAKHHLRDVRIHWHKV